MRSGQSFVKPVLLALLLAGCRGKPDHRAPAPATDASTAPSATASASAAIPWERLFEPPPAPPAATEEDPHLPDVDAAVLAAIARKEIPGAVVIAGQGDRTVHRRAYGQRSLDPPEPTTIDTVYDLASLTKPFATALAVMRMVEDGALALGDRASKHLPELRKGERASITIEQLLLHTSGLPAGHAADERELRDPVHEIAKLDLASKPGERFVYSDLGYVLLQKIVEKVAERPLQNVAGRVWVPLGLKDTTFSPTERELPRCAPTEKREGVMLRCKVHDKRAAAQGGVAGHAGLFSTADDLAKLSRMLLRRGHLGLRVMGTETVKEMTRPRRVSEKGHRALGWDVDTGYSHNRGDRFGKQGYGHTGFTGTSVWIDPPTDSYVIVLTNRLHPDGKGDAKRLRREVATAVAEAVSRPRARLGVDVLFADDKARVEGKRVGLLTHRAAVDARGVTTKERFFREPGVRLARLFSPEHGADATGGGAVADTLDASTGVRVVSLYGAKLAPSAKDLEGLDAMVIDLVDAGARFYTYESTLGHVMAACEKAKLPVIVLDRPSPAGAGAEGPVLAKGKESFVAFHTVPIRHGLTMGELATLYRTERFPAADLHVVKVDGWRHEDGFPEGVPWIKPSPNLKTLLGARLYPGVALLEFTRVSVGRGTDEPFTLVGAPYVDPRRFVEALASDPVPGLGVEAATFTPTDGPFVGRACGGVRLSILDEATFRPVRAGIALAQALFRAYPKEWGGNGLETLLGGEAVRDLVLGKATFAEVEEAWADELAGFAPRAAAARLYP